MLLFELSLGVVGGMRHARGPAHDRGAMIGCDRISLHRAIVRDVESQNALLIALPPQNVQERYAPSSPPAPTAGFSGTAPEFVR